MFLIPYSLFPLSLTSINTKAVLTRDLIHHPCILLWDLLVVPRPSLDISELMQMVYWWFPIPTRMPMCATSSNQRNWPLWSVWARDPFAALRLDRSSPVVDRRMYKVCIQYDSIGILSDSLMQFCGIMHGCVYHRLCDLGWYIFKTYCFMNVVQDTMLNAADDSYEHTFILKPIPSTFTRPPQYYIMCS